MHEDDNTVVEQFTPIREVFYYKVFMDCLEELYKKQTGLEEEYAKKISSIVYNLMTVENLRQFLKNRKVEVSTNTKHTIQRIRLTTGEHLNTGLSRIFFCHAREIPSLKDNNEFNDDDIVLLHFTYDAEGHDNISEIFESLDKDITAISEKNIKKPRVLTILKNNLIYKFIRNKKDEYNSVPVLSYNQKLCLECCITNPPCIIHGSAGSGKTILSEELYKEFSKNTSEKTLYITYMDQLKLLVNDDLKNKRNIENTDCKTIDDLVREHLGDNLFRNKYKKEADFKNWVRTNEKLNKQCIFDKYKGGINGLLNKINKDTDLAISIAYIFYRTFSTESKYRSFNNNPNKQKLSDKEYFLQQCISEEGLDENQKSNVFYLCQQYENYLKSNGYINDNEAARRIAEKNIRRYDNIIVDEVQDLTEVQLKCLTTLLKEGSSHFFAFGDDNQSINPTMMEISDVRTCLGQYLNTKIDFPENIDEKIKPLGTSYRSVACLVNYINYINDVRRDSIGRNKAYNEKDQESALGSSDDEESDYPAYILDSDDSKLSDSCLSQKDVVRLNNAVIITANDKTKDRLLKKFPHLNEEGTEYVCTIEETKGREWDQVILYNFFSSAESIWNNITRDKDEKNAGVTSEGKHSTIYRMYFNRYYVGLTRAKNKIIIVETDDISDKIKKTYFLKGKNVEGVSFEHLKNKAKFNEYFKNEYTHKVWDLRALECFKKLDFEEALARQRKAIVALDADDELSQSEKVTVKASYENKCERYTIYQSVSKGDIASKSINQYLSLFIEDRNVDFMRIIYEFTKDTQKRDLLKIDPRVDYDRYLALFNQLGDKMIDSEKEFFNSNAILAYKQKIFKTYMGES